MKTKRKPNLNVDFDGTVVQAGKFISPGVITNPPNDGCKEALDHLNKFFNIIIFSVRATSSAGVKGIEEYMKKYDLPYSHITNIKAAGLILDDNCTQFRGWGNALKDLANFKHWKADKKEKL
jgi:hypothetical protein